jgi:HK97 family phage portal protein
MATKIIDRFYDKLASHLAARTKSTYKLTDPTLAAIAGLVDKDQLNKPYKQLPVVYACVNTKARNIAGVDFELFKQGSDEPVTRGGLVNLFEDINPVMNRYQFFEALSVQLDIKGNFFIYPDPETDREGVPLNLWVFPGQWVKPLYRNGVWVGWDVTWNKQKLLLQIDELIHYGEYNPYDSIIGLAPIEAAYATLDVKWNALQFNKRFFDNDATPGVVIEGEKNISEQQQQRLEYNLFEKRKGVKNAHRGLLLTGGLTAKTLALSNKDLQMLETLKLTTEEVLYVFGVPKFVLSINEDTNYATALTQKRIFWTDTLIPRMRAIEATLNQSLLNKLGYYGRFNLNSIDALNAELLEKVEAATKLYQMGFTANEINERLQFGFEEQPWRDLPYQPMSPFSAPQVEPPDEKGLRGDLQAPRITQEEMAKAQFQAQWKKLDDEILPVMAKTAKEIRKYFNDVKQKLLTNLTKRLAGAELKSIADEFEDALNHSIDDEKLRRVIEPFITDAMQRGINSVGIAFALADDAAMKYILLRTQEIVGVNETLRSKLLVSLRESIKEGMTEQEATQAVMEAVGTQIDQARTRARTIARTEVHAAYSDGRQEAMEATEPYGKMWISSNDPKVRAEHQISGQVRKWGDAFSNGLQRPHDPNGAAGNVINCRCKCVAIYDPEEYRARGGK